MVCIPLMPSAVRNSGDNPVPCDILLLQGSCIVDEALLTGESVPQMKVHRTQFHSKHCPPRTQFHSKYCPPRTLYVRTHVNSCCCHSYACPNISTCLLSSYCTAQESVSSSQPGAALDLERDSRLHLISAGTKIVQHTTGTKQAVPKRMCVHTQLYCMRVSYVIMHYCSHVSSVL